MLVIREAQRGWFPIVILRRTWYMYVYMYVCMYVKKIYKFDVSICVLTTGPFLTMESISMCIRTFYNKL